MRDREDKKITSTSTQCTLCPHGCEVDREVRRGFCETGAGLEIASVTVHKGEEPVISGQDGICNIFFSGCNLRCIYCQNHQISWGKSRLAPLNLTLPELIDRITVILDRGIENIGFVSPTHMLPQMQLIIRELHHRNYFPIVIYNSNAYEKVETLRLLEGLVDVYLPDFKYMDPELAARWSKVGNYPQMAGAAIKEMYRQKGNRLFYTDSGKLSSGMIVRHLVLPGAVANSIAVFRYLAEELSTRLAVSLMAQYLPTTAVSSMAPLHRKITAAEYLQVVHEVEELGFETGWLQDFDSAECYNPDFTLPSPFG